mmetsp:Transcript_43371/g.107155  ORF Transcript_43371/g.107155 Transcript_43371/m.107155 type:complete len:235 (-) Transcript_43371:710-1414(-)
MSWLWRAITGSSPVADQVEREAVSGAMVVAEPQAGPSQPVLPAPWEAPKPVLPAPSGAMVVVESQSSPSLPPSAHLNGLDLIMLAAANNGGVVGSSVAVVSSGVVVSSAAASSVTNWGLPDNWADSGELRRELATVVQRRRLTGLLADIQLGPWDSLAIAESEVKTYALRNGFNLKRESGVRPASKNSGEKLRLVCAKTRARPSVATKRKSKLSLESPADEDDEEQVVTSFKYF